MADISNCLGPLHYLAQHGGTVRPLHDPLGVRTVPQRALSFSARDSVEWRQVLSPEDLPPTRPPRTTRMLKSATERHEFGSCHTESNSSTVRPTSFGNGAPTHEASRAPSRLWPTSIGRLAPSRCVSSMRMGVRFIPRIGAMSEGRTATRSRCASAAGSASITLTN